MDILTYVGIALLGALLIYMFIIYNALVNANIHVEEVFVRMDIYLKQRWDVIPSILEAVKGYDGYEEIALESKVDFVTMNYEQMSESDKIAVNSKIDAALPLIMKLADSYLNIESYEKFLSLSKQLELIEIEISKLRDQYNKTVKIMNKKITTVPSSIVAKLFDYKELKELE